MHILALETSGQRGSLALLVGESERLETIGQATLTSERRTAQALAPALRSLLADAACPPDSIDLVAVAIGPGSFTSLRIGVTAAKAFAYAVGAEIIGVDTLAVVAHQAPPADEPLWTIMDAQRGELYIARFEPAADYTFAITRDTEILAQDAWIRELGASDRVTGPATRRVLAMLPSGVAAVPEQYWQPTAEAVGFVGWQHYRAGQRDDVWQLVPRYYRPSAAEEKAAHRDRPTRR